jgi:hypothetical protein
VNRGGTVNGKNDTAMENIRAVADRVGLLLASIVGKCAEDRDVYTLDELLREMSEKLVSEAENIDDTRVLLTTAELIGCMKQEYFRSKGTAKMLNSLMEFYISEIKKRFDGDLNKKN